MTRKMSKALVIDASVARSAGTTQHPVSSSCRNTLEAVLKICHRVVMCKEISDEWKKHQSRYSSSWLVSMQSKGKVVRVDLTDDKDLSSKLQELEINQAAIKAMLKDLHLVRAARQTDSRIISSDDAARNLFIEASEQIDELRPITWVNPTIAEDSCIEWLKAGAKKQD